MLKILKLQITNYIIWYLGCGILYLTSCDTNRVFEENKRIPHNFWYKDSIISFEFEITDTVSFHNIYINIRNEGTYPYSNIFFFIKIRPLAFAGLNPQKEFIDTVECTLADARGRWLGKGFGSLSCYQMLYKKDVVFPRKGKYIFEIAQGMRAKDDKLEGIKDIGLRIEKENS